MNFRILVVLAIFITPTLRADDVNVLAENEIVLAVDSTTMAYKRKSTTLLDAMALQAAEKVCQIKGYSKHSRHVLTDIIQTPTLWVIEQEALVQKPVTFSKPWVFVKNPPLTPVESFILVQDLSFISTCTSTALAFSAMLISPEMLKSAWYRTDPWAGYALDLNIYAAAGIAPWIIPRVKRCYNGVCRSWLNFEITQEQAQQRIREEQPIYAYQTGSQIIGPRAFTEIWCSEELPVD